MYMTSICLPLEPTGTSNSLFRSGCQNVGHPDDHNLPTYDMPPGFKPFTVSPISRKKQYYHRYF